MTGRNILLALPLSLSLTFIVVIVWFFYPLIIAIITNQQGSGIGVFGGISFFLLLFIELFLFAGIFAVLQWRSKKKDFN